MLKQHVAPETLSEAIRFFADPDRALAFVVQLRWKNGVICPHCAAEKPSFLRSRRIWKCRNPECRKQFSMKVGTIFEDSPLGFDKWLPAMWMLANAKNGISSYEVGRALGVTQKTGWFMLGRLRLAMQTLTFERMSGEVEVDETFVGGRAANMPNERRARVVGRNRGAVGKTIVVGLLERKRGRNASQVRASRIPNTRRRVLDSEVRANVEPGSKVYTDSLKSYSELGDEYIHATVDHAVEYARGAVHTNGLENFWSMFKRTIKGTYVSIDPFHVNRYLDEQTFRFNQRKGTDGSRFIDVLRQIVGRRLTYADLIGADLIPATT